MQNGVLYCAGRCDQQVKIQGYRIELQDVEKNFKAGAEDVLTQLTDTLDLRLNAVEMRVRGLVSNTTFMRTMVNYLNKPDEKNRVKALGEAASFLKDLESGESLVHSSYIYTDKGDFENFIRMRNWSFDFKTSKFYQAYQEQGVLAVQWFPTQKDEIFKDEDDVIPYVRRFTLDGYYHGGYQYLVVQLKKIELDRILSGKYGYFDQLLIVNENGELLAGSDGVNTKKLIEIAKPSVKNGSATDSTYEQDKIKYLVFSDTLDTTGWKIWTSFKRFSIGKFAKPACTHCRIYCDHFSGSICRSAACIKQPYSSTYAFRKTNEYCSGR